ncbi:3-deoxy-manno-octulosonate cytidylyltransferase [Maribacter sp. PR1]|uniref:3-deoxy-manno-octulosonate cytidylyltransferase n=1 Tax=Maribacter cobaltidurans TaxID=1178778 RepID=A0ABU7IQF7_9FLAO|nr:MULTISPECIES: 3-deoxy-manno-octulosonate cytidylyltransferase [Maribacter]MDC6387798.1 3-deoxy-manno-octulosonate cytidylyltransferase [Maribacter sp. PR1]MEE1975186.1 3-deoxy-manno-octulosonate cytidylyltransferase [Maribacter cobaltidurans]
MRIVGVIPARYKSSRFPGKPLIELVGIPMIIRVAMIVEKALGKKHTYIATDDQRIQELAESYGYNAVMTSEHCLTGTDRVWEFSKQIDADIYVNVQGDEPLLNYKDILKVAETKKKNKDYIINGMCSIGIDEDVNNVNIPKVLVNDKNKLIYMSRLPIPGMKSNKNELPIYKKQVCIYGFNNKELKAFGKKNIKSTYEDFEDIEILRFFDLGIPIKMVETSGNSLAVDCPEDVLKVEAEILRLERDE